MSTQIIKFAKSMVRSLGGLLAILITLLAAAGCFVALLGAVCFVTGTVGMYCGMTSDSKPGDLPPTLDVGLKIVAVIWVAWMILLAAKDACKGAWRWLTDKWDEAGRDI